MAREEKFNWKGGDIKVQLPQCGDCAKNTGPTSCEEFGQKPDKYVENKYKCPEKIVK